MSSETTAQRPACLEDIAAQVAALAPWFHNLHLPGGVQTVPGHWLGDFPRFKWEQIAPHLPADLSGWSALDIGCNAGFYSFALAQRGARVAALDVDEHYLRQARWAARQFGLEQAVSFRQAQIYGLAREATRYDLVLFMGVLYHLRYPLLGLKVAARKVRRLMVFQTLTAADPGPAPATTDLTLEERHRLMAPGWPKLAVIEHRLQGDPTNWWVPNENAVEALLRAVGLRVRARPGHEIYICEPDPDHVQLAADAREAEYRAALGL